MGKSGRFREDLFCRLNVIEGTLPRLRERRKDLAAVARHLLGFFAWQSGKAVTGFTSEAEAAMAAYAWPGNVRELRNAVERGVILTPDTQVGLEHLPGQLTAAGAARVELGAAVTLEELEAEHIRRVMASSPSLDEAAKVLGIDPSTLYRKRSRAVSRRRRLMTLRTRILRPSPTRAAPGRARVGGFVLLDRTGGRIDAILRENYESVQAMFRLNGATERIDSSLQFALAGREGDAVRQFEANWKSFDEQFEVEAKNITIHPTEDELVNLLRNLRADYREQGRRFYALPPGSPERAAAYFGRPGDPGLLSRFQSIKETAGEILRINYENMIQTRDDARATARSALVAFCAGLAVVSLLLVGVGWYLLRTILRPIRAVTEAAHAIGGSGELDRVVPVFGRDELGRLAVAFNAMTRELRKYRRSNLDRLMRAQRTAQATIDSFPDPVLVIDPAGRVEMANPAAQALFGIGPAAGGEPGPAWQPPESLRQPVAEALRVQRAHQPEQFDQSVSFRSGGADRTYLPQVRPIRDPQGDTLGAAVVLTDVTRFRMLDQFKTDLVSTVSHELKTPLTSVRLAVHVLLEEAVGPLTPKQAELSSTPATRSGCWR